MASSKKAQEGRKKAEATPKTTKKSKATYTAPTAQEWREDAKLASLWENHGKGAPEVHRLLMAEKTLKAQVSKYRKALKDVASRVEDSPEIVARIAEVLE